MYENLDLKLDGTYTITDKGRLSNETGVHEIPFTGTSPTGGYLTYENNVLTSGCITIDEYKVNIEAGEITTIEKGSCVSLFLTACDSSIFNPSPESWFNFDSSTGTITGFSDAWDGTTDITIPCQIGGVDVVNIGNGTNVTGVFSNKNLTNIVINDNIKVIGIAAFSSNAIEEVILPEGVQELYPGSFTNNRIKEINIPSSVKLLGSGSFAQNDLREVTINGQINEIQYTVFYKSSTSNLNLSLIYNNSGISYDWNSIITGTSGGEKFETGTVVTETGNVVIVN